MRPSEMLAVQLQALWYRERPPPRALRLLARLFASAVELRRKAYARGLLASRRVGKPVVVVGNISVGGSGKTPLVIWLCEQFLRLGLRPGVVLRGYGGSAVRQQRPCLVEPDSDAAVVGDEALLLRRRTRAPVVVCRDRVRAALRVAAEPVDVIVADDGLQHLALARDFELAVIDGVRGLGNGYLLPAGPLREPRDRLQSVDAVVVNGEATSTLNGEATPTLGEGIFSRQPPQRTGAAAGAPFLMRLQGNQLWPLDGAAAPIALSELAGQCVHAVAGIAHPQRFFAHLTAAGLRLIAHPFADHHLFRAHELDFGDDLPLLMTEKDAVKCRPFAASNRWFLPVAASFAEAQEALLMGQLSERIGRPRAVPR